MKLFLVGYMGSGKSTLGRRLAEVMGLKHLDLDDYLEKSESRTIPEIFEGEGEAGFRGIERRCLQEIIDSQDEVVISTGGGTPCFYDNMQKMNEAGLTIYLRMDVKSLVFRLENSKQDRPLLRGKDLNEMDAYVRQHLEERKHYYEEAVISVDGMGLSDKRLEQLVEAIVNYSR